MKGRGHVTLPALALLALLLAASAVALAPTAEARHCDVWDPGWPTAAACALTDEAVHGAQAEACRRLPPTCDA